MKALLITIAFLVVTGCATLKPSQGPALRLDDVHLGGATAVAFAPDGRRLASGGHDGTVSVWRAPDGKRLMRARPHRDPVRGIAWLDRDRVVSAAEDGRVTVWDASSGKVLREVKHQVVSAMVYDAERGRVITGLESGTVRLLSAQDLDEIGAASVGAPVTALAYHPPTRRLAVATERDEVLLLDDALQVVQRLRAPRGVYGLRFAPDGDTLAGGAWFALLVWDLESGELQMRDTEHFGAIIAMDYAPDGEQLATIGRHTDGGIRVVDADSNQVVRRLMAHNACGWSVRFSPDGRYLATASEDESIRLYDLHEPYRPKFHHGP